MDTRDAYRRHDSASVWGQLYHKKRAYVFGHVVIPVHIFFSTCPIVALTGSTFSRYQAGGPSPSRLPTSAIWTARHSLRTFGLPGTRRARRADASGCIRARPRLCRHRLFDVADGRVVLWEANPHPYIPGWLRAGMPLVRHTRPRLNRIHAATATFFRTLIHDSIGNRRTA